ncbi:MAG: DUF423 domain-containing protein [Proteobacteria bacterium]|nr:DUF423 domain-containing protein [Pseudomonadota bacterium]
MALAGLLLALATACGAFGAHALKASLPPERLALWETAVRYQFFQALGLMGIGLALRGADLPALRLSAHLILIGTVLFCGSLYLLAFPVPRGFGAVAPVGGLALIAGWILFAWGLYRH